MKRVLIIDDEPLARYTMKAILEEEGFEIMEASNGQEGIDADKAMPADLIITDIIMPDKEGIETIVEFQRERPEVKIIAISGGGRLKSNVPLKLAQKVGATRVLSKPFGVVELIRTVRECL